MPSIDNPTAEPTILTLDNTIAVVTSNSYCDVNYANAYFQGHYNSAYLSQWASLSPQQQTQLLMAACRVIETARFTNYVPISEYTLHYDRITGKILDITLTREPVKYYYYQRLQFPRNLDIDPNTNLIYIPEPILMAQCEQAVYLLNYDQSAVQKRTTGITQENVAIGKGGISVAQTFVHSGSAFAPMALEFCRPFFITGQRMRRG